MTKMASKKKVPAKKPPAKKTVRVRKVKDYDFDSDLSVADDVDYSTSKRPSRSAAKAAVKRMNVSSKDWAGSDSDSDAFSEGTDPSSDDESSDGYYAAPVTRNIPKTSTGKRAPPVQKLDDSSDEDESEDEAAIARATKRQKVAFALAKNAKNAKKVMEPKKSFKAFGKFEVAKPKKKGGGKPSFDDDDDSSDGDDDPLKGVDMDALREEALEGCQPSVLHTMSWWRIVLDEAHMIKSRSSQTAAAAFHLSAVHRWALSGTPLQVGFALGKNRNLVDLMPFSDYYWIPFTDNT